METPVKYINTCTALIPNTENNRLPSGPAIHLYITSKRLEFVDCCTPRQTSYAQINIFPCDLTSIYTIIKVHVLNETPGQAERVKRDRWRPWKAKLLKIWPAEGAMEWILIIQNRKFAKTPAKLMVHRVRSITCR
jgi:hypothetical protein